MSLVLIENAINDFLASSRPEVLAIHGAWGNGKTFFWKKIIKSKRLLIPMPLKRYSYVSLFGLNSLTDLKNAIFENTIACEAIGDEPSITTLNANLNSIYPSAKQWGTKIAKGIPFVKNFGEVINSAIHLSIKNCIICLDDLERKGVNLSINEIMGLISSLKEERNCKIVLIYNEVNMDDEAKKNYPSVKEKIIDKNIEFSLTTEECCEIALKKDDIFYNHIKHNIVNLKIQNIRIIQKIERLSYSLKDLKLENYSEKVIIRLLHSLCLFCFCYYSQNDEKVPPIDFLKNIGHKMYTIKKEDKITPQEELYLAFLRDYGYSSTDACDLILMKGIEKGFFDIETINEIERLNKEALKEETLESLTTTWSIYHDSLDSNTEELVSALKTSYYQNSENIPIDYVDPMLDLFRLVGESTLAEEILTHYINILKRKKIVITKENYPFFDRLKDQGLIKRLADLEQNNIPQLSIGEALHEISKRKSWSEHQVIFLSNCTVQDFKTIFKHTRGPDLSSYIDTCLKFGKIVPQKESYQQIYNTAHLALTEIAKETPLNRARLSRFGIQID